MSSLYVLKPQAPAHTVSVLKSSTRRHQSSPQLEKSHYSLLCEMDTNYPSTKDCGPHTAAPSQRRKIFTDAEFEQRKSKLWSSLSKKTSEISTAREKLFENTEDILRYGSLNAILDERSKSQVQVRRRKTMS